jgi:hypothetical protein
VVYANHISGVIYCPVDLLLVQLVELVSAVVFVGLALEPPRHVLADLTSSMNGYEGCTIISLLSRSTSVFMGMAFLAEKRGTGSSGLEWMVEKLGLGWWVMMLEERPFWVRGWLLK